MILPFVMGDPFQYQKRVLAHRVPLFRLSIDNAPPASDYWENNWLTVGGEGGKHAPYGGFSRGRPPGLPVSTAANWPLLNMQTEVRQAIAQGITGFWMDVQSLTDNLSLPSLNTMLAAAAAVDPRFCIGIMPDMSSLGGMTQDQLVSLVSNYADPIKYPNIFRLSDGRIVVSPFNAGVQPQAFWQGGIAKLNAKGIDVAFIPTFLGSPASNPYAAISHGYAGWGTAEPGAASTCPPMMMMPVLTQQFRPDGLAYWEAGNLGTFVAGWKRAVAVGSDLVMLVTWNDFSETSQVMPFTDASLAPNLGSAFAELCPYFALWYLSGIQPPITKDVLYVCYRKMPFSALHPAQIKSINLVQGTATDNIECLAFLVTPGTVVINGVGTACPAGITSVKAPIAPGIPTFALQRDGSDVLQGTGLVTIYGSGGSPSGTQDLTYWGSSISN
jgi:hypothetical protein